MITPLMCAAAQDLSNLKVAELTPLTPEVISRQATINIGEWIGFTFLPCCMHAAAVRQGGTDGDMVCA